MQADERETSVAYTDSDDVVRVFTCIRKDITALKKKDQFTLLDEVTYEDGTIGAWFSIPRDKFDIARAAKTTRVMSEDQRLASAERLQKARNRKEANE